MGSKITADGDCSHETKKHLLLEEKLWQNWTAYWKAEALLCGQILNSQSYGFSSGHVWMWELDHKESWALKNRCFWTVALEKTLASSLNIKEVKPVNPKGNQSWLFIGRTDAVAEAQILWPPDVKNWLIEKTLMLGKIEGRRRRNAIAWNGWMTSLTQWTWVWASSGSWWWTGKPGMLQSMGSQRTGHDWGEHHNIVK